MMLKYRKHKKKRGEKMIDKIMDILEVQHENVEKTRLA